MSAIKIKTYQCHKCSINLDNFRFFCIPIIQRWDNYLREYAEENSIQFYRTCHKKEREICMWENKKGWFSSLVKHKWIHAGIFIVFHFVQIFFFFFFVLWFSLCQHFMLDNRFILHIDTSTLRIPINNWQVTILFRIHETIVIIIIWKCRNFMQWITSGS